MPGRDLHYSELVEVGQRIRKRDLSSVEATQAQLDRIARPDEARLAAVGEAFQRITDRHRRHPSFEDLRISR